MCDAFSYNVQDHVRTRNFTTLRTSHGTFCELLTITVYFVKKTNLLKYDYWCLKYTNNDRTRVIMIQII